MHPTDPSRSLIIGTVKVAAPAGAVVAYGLDGQIRQMIPGIDRPNNIDVEYGIRLRGQPVDAREGAPGNPHDHSREIAVLRGGADATDGLDISSAALGPTLPHGLMIAMNSKPQNFLVFRWEDVAAAIRQAPQLNGQPSAK